MFRENSHTIAFGLNVPKALGDFLILDALHRTGGCAMALDGEELLQAQATLASTEGMLACPEGAATLAAATKLREAGWIQEDERVVLLNTGMGIKYPETVRVTIPLLQPQDEIREGG